VSVELVVDEVNMELCSIVDMWRACCGSELNSWVVDVDDEVNVDFVSSSNIVVSVNELLDDKCVDNVIPFDVSVSVFEELDSVDNKSDLVWEDDTISWLVYRLVVVSRLLIEDSILKLESRSFVIVVSASDVGELVTVLSEFNIAETDIFDVDVEDSVVMRGSDVWSLDDVERDEVIVNIVCSEVLFEFWLKAVAWVDSFVDLDVLRWVVVSVSIDDIGFMMAW
jgi:hypothetical protein